MFRWRMIEGLDDCSCSKSCFLLGILSSRLDGFFLASAEGSTPIWWRRAKFSSCRPARERKIEVRVARSDVRRISIAEKL
jgi:hypothetical protein